MTYSRGAVGASMRPTTPTTDWEDEIKGESCTAIYKFCTAAKIDDRHAVSLAMISEKFIDKILQTQKEEIRNMPAYKNLKEEQEQLDEDGIMVAVSRQAVCELLTALEDTTTSPAN